MIHELRYEKIELHYENGIWPNDQPTPGYDPYYDPLFICDVPSLQRMFNEPSLQLPDMREAFPQHPPMLHKTDPDRNTSGPEDTG